MQEIIQYLSNLVWNILNRPGIIDYIDMLIVAIILYQLLRLTKRTRAIQVLKGFAILMLSFWVSDLLRLRTLNYILRWLVNSGAVVLIVLFQPEIRTALEQLGRANIFSYFRTDQEYEERLRVVEEMVQAMVNLGKRRVGALVVIERRTPLRDVVDTGTLVDARISQPLLENIFEPNTPLHDGAVLIRSTRIVSAACLLPLSEGKSISRDLGTRHRAALGVSEVSDAVVMIVSEETGIISYARGGKLMRHMDAASLTQMLSQLYLEQDSGRPASGLFKRR